MNFEPTNLPIENKYPKLVRDNIPNLIEARTGILPNTKIIADDTEFLKYLLKKVIEESSELEYSLEKGNMKEELADLFELITALLALKGWTMEDITVVQKAKREKNGGFDKRILMLNK